MTTVEVEAKKTQLEASMKDAQAKLKGLKPFSDDFDALMAEYLKAKSQLSKIDEEFAKAKADEAHNAIKAQCTTIAEALTKLVAGLEIAKLINEPVKTVMYVVDSEGKAQVSINKVKQLRGTSAGKDSKGKGHTKIVDSTGAEFSITAFVKAHATADELKSKAYAYPHTVADTKAKFETFCTNHNLTGYEYKVPAKAEAEEAES